jgi:hypothetical protein
VWGEDHVFGRKLMLESCRRSSDVNFHFLALGREFNASTRQLLGHRPDPLMRWNTVPTQGVCNCSKKAFALNGGNSECLCV